MHISITVDSGSLETDDLVARKIASVIEQLATPRVSYGFDAGQVPGRTYIPVEPAKPRYEYRHKEYTRLPVRIKQLVEQAVRLRAPVDITYEDRNGTFTRRDYSPSRVYVATSPTGKPAWYVTGYCQAREDPRTLRLDRIKALEVR